MAVKTWQNMAESCRIPPFFVGCGPRQNGVIGGQATFFLGPISQPNFPAPPVLCYDSKVPATLHSSHALSGTTGAGSWCFMQWGTYFGVSGD